MHFGVVMPANRLRIEDTNTIISDFRTLLAMFLQKVDFISKAV